ncbi:hypothetical protein D3C80_1695590 [compost metagenome]
MGHFELGTHGPATGLVHALQVGNPQENVGAFTGANTHLSVAVRANKFVGAAHCCPLTLAGLYSWMVAATSAVRAAM